MKPKSKELLLILFLALSVSILISIKVFIYDGCYAFDSNDDANHTFVNLKAAQDIMKNGSVPEINLYNNFGTPLLGDALTFPFSIQSITYWFLPNYLAMTINRAIIAFLTMIFLFLFLRSFLSPISSFVSTIIVFFAPGAFWNFAHHHYQMTLLCFSWILFIQTRLLRSARNDDNRHHETMQRHSERTYVIPSKARDLLLLWLGYFIFILSVSLQLVVFSLPFLILYLPIMDGLKKNKALTLNLTALILAIVATWPHISLFFHNIADSTRANWSPFSSVFTTLRDQILSLLFPPTEWIHYGINGHFTVATYFSIAFIIFAIVGAISLISRNRKLLLLIILLGFLPAIAGFLLQFRYGQYLPFFRSVDSSRVWWFSNIFLALAVGSLIDSKWKSDFSIIPKAIICFLTITIIIFYFAIPFKIFEIIDLALIHKLIILFTSISLILVLLSRKQYTVGKLLIITTILLAQIPTLIHVMGLNMGSCSKWNHYFSYKEAATFQPLHLLQEMEPHYRLASEEYTVEGHDLKAIFADVLGSDARAIISSQLLQNILLDNKLIKIDANYFFTQPWQSDKVSELGIRYLLVKEKSKDLASKKWNLIAEDKDNERGYFLYENPLKPTIAHIDQDGNRHFIKELQLIPNGIDLELPDISKEGNLIVSLSFSKSYRVYVDEKETPASMNYLGMMQIPIKPGNKNVHITFNRTSWFKLFSYIFISIVLLISSLYFFTSRIFGYK